MKLIISNLLVALLIVSKLSISQETKIDSLMNQLSIAKEDANKVSLLNNIGLILITSNPDESKKKALETLELAKKLNYSEGIGAAYNLLALNEEDRGNYDKAIQYYIKALEILEKGHDNESIATIYHNIGKAYELQQDFKQASEYLIKGLELYKKINNNYGIANSYNTLGTLYRSQDKINKAKEYHEKAITYAKKTENDRIIAITSLNFAGDLDYVNDFELVIQSFDKALDAFIKMNDKKGEAITLNNLGAVYLENKKYKKAINFFNKSIQKAKIIDFKPLQSHNYWLINKAYSDDGNYKKANEYALMLNDINDSLLNETKVKVIAELETKYQVEKKEQELLIQEKEIKILEKDKKISNYIFYSIITFFSLLIISAFGWFRAYKQRKIIQENEIRHQLNLYIKEIELLKVNTNLTGESEEPKTISLNNNQLSEREIEVLNELSEGKTNKEISETLFVSVNTVKTHLKNIYEKLDVKNRTQAVKKSNHFIQKRRNHPKG